MDSASATETVDLASIPGRVKPKTTKLVFIVCLLYVQLSPAGQGNLMNKI